MVVAVEPLDACKPINPPPAWNTADNYIALIRRGNCKYEEKVRVAQKAKYNAVIVYNNHSDVLEPMGAENTTGIRIPAVFIGWTKGEKLGMYYANANYFVIINNERPFDIQTHLILPFAIVVGICFIVMIVFMVSGIRLDLVLSVLRNCCLQIINLLLLVYLKIVADFFYVDSEMRERSQKTA